MRKYLGFLMILVALCVVGSLSATISTAPSNSGAVLDEPLAEVALPWQLSFGGPAGESCSAAALVLDDLTGAGSCVPENQVCRSPWFNGECCPGLNCTYLYPNVPWYCL